MRPKSIATFESLYLLAILMEAVSIALHWPLLAGGPAVNLWARLAAVVISLLLVLLTSRRRSRAAALVLGALFVIGLPVAVGALATEAPLVTVLPLGVQLLLQVAAFIMLLRPESRAWLGRREG